MIGSLVLALSVTEQTIVIEENNFISIDATTKENWFSETHKLVILYGLLAIFILCYIIFQYEL